MKVALGQDKYKLRPQERLYTALLNLDFTWTRAELRDVMRLWNSGAHIGEIAEVVGRDGDEVALLIMDLVRNDRLKPREGGVYGDQT